MKGIRVNGKPDVHINSVELYTDTRNKNHAYICPSGRNKKAFIYVKTGELSYTFTKENKSYRLDKGKLLFMPEFMAFRVDYHTDNTTMYILAFDLDDSEYNHMFSQPLYKKVQGIDNVFSSFTEMNMYNIFFITSKIYEILYLLEESDPYVHHSPYHKILPAINELQLNYFENRKLSYYADMCYMSESNFRKLFKEYTGKSLIEYRNLIRISHADRLIKNKECTAIQAAYITGFNNMPFFYEVYKKYKKSKTEG